MTDRTERQAAEPDDGFAGQAQEGVPKPALPGIPTWTRWC
jgi:hypothetical protein